MTDFQPGQVVVHRESGRVGTVRPQLGGCDVLFSGDDRWSPMSYDELRPATPAEIEAWEEADG